MAQPRMLEAAPSHHYSGSGVTPRRRQTVVVEYYRIASLSMTVMQFHNSFNTGRTQEEKTHFLRDCVNQGWPAASAFRLALSVATYLMQAAKVRTEAVLQLIASEVQAATVTQLDVQHFSPVTQRCRRVPRMHPGIAGYTAYCQGAAARHH